MASNKPTNTQVALSFNQANPHLVYVTEVESFAGYNDNGYYELLPKKTMSALMFKHLLARYPELDATKSAVNDILFQLTNLVRNVPETDDSYLAFSDCLLDLDTFTTEPHDSDVICDFGFPYEYRSLEMETPNLHKFLETTFPNQPLRDYFCDILGALLLPQASLSSAFFFVGEGANGKSVAADLITSLIGSAYVSTMPLDVLTTRPFATAHLVGKRLNVCNEEESKFLKSDRFKALVSGDAVNAERKFGDTFFFKPKAKFVFCSNNLPSFDTMDYGLKRRIKILPFLNTFDPEKQDKLLHDKLRAELPGVLNIALKHAKKLKDRNYVFSFPKEVAEFTSEFEQSSSSVIAYAKECNIKYDEDNHQWYPVRDIYRGYKDYCKDSNRKPLSIQKFARELKRYDSNIGSETRTINGSSVKCYPIAPFGEFSTKPQTDEVAD